MDQLQISSIKKTKTGNSVVFKKATKEQLKDIPATIEELKTKKINFKFVKKDVEKTYKYNGNNYIVTSKSLK